MADFCVRSGLLVDALGSSSSSLRSDSLTLEAAREWCVAQPHCAGFMCRTDAALLPSRRVAVTFFRTAHMDNHATASDVGLACDDDWVSFVRGPACPAAASSPPPSPPSPLPPPLPQRGVTLVTQLTSDRMWMLKELVQRWPGPVVAAVLQPVGEAPGQLPAELRSRVQLLQFRQRDRSEQYPINALRNRAVAAVRTSHLMVCDVDLWPSESLSSEFSALDDTWWATRRLALVVPAFGLDSRATATEPRIELPMTLGELRGCVAARRCAAFKGADGFVPGQHLSTDYARWWARSTAALPYRVPCVDKVSWEPYLVLPAGGGAPPYDERFTGYGKNKVQHVQALRAAGFQFWVLPRGYLMHMPHRASASTRKWQSQGSDHRAKMDALFEEQLALQPQRARELAEREPTRDGCAAVTPSCQIPLLQQIDMLQPDVVGRRAPLLIDG